MPASSGGSSGVQVGVAQTAAATAPSELYRRGVEIWRAGRREDASRLLQDILEGRHGPIDRKLRRRILSRLLIYVSRLSWSDTERLARQAIERFPKEAFGYHHLGEALLRQGAAREAEASLLKAVELNPGDDEARQLLRIVRRGAGVSAAAETRPRPWPDRQPLFDDPRKLLERYLLRGYPDQPIVQPGTVFTTLGSCFAENLAGRLRDAGYRVNSEPIGEEVNSTFANRCLVQWIEHGPVDGPTRVIDEAYGPARRQRLSKALKATDVLVLTLGVAPCFFDRETGEFAFSSVRSATGRGYLAEHCVMRTTTVAENVANLGEIIAAAERIAGRRLEIVLTVSPVSLGGTSEFYSAVVADCLSKSTLRLACQEAIQARPDLIYWPSFEIVRWLGVHYTRPEAPVFGAEDGSTRHVSNWLVDLIVELFIAHHSVRSGG